MLLYCGHPPGSKVQAPYLPQLKNLVIDEVF